MEGNTHCEPHCPTQNTKYDADKLRENQRGYLWSSSHLVHAKQRHASKSSGWRWRRERSHFNVPSKGEIYMKASRYLLLLNWHLKVFPGSFISRSRPFPDDVSAHLPFTRPRSAITIQVSTARLLSAATYQARRRSQSIYTTICALELVWWRLHQDPPVVCTGASKFARDSPSYQRRLLPGSGVFRAPRGKGLPPTRYSHDGHVQFKIPHGISVERAAGKVKCQFEGKYHFRASWWTVLIEL